MTNRRSDGRRGAPTRSRGDGRAAAAASGVEGNGAAAQPVRVRELDPHAACGAGTTVLQLYRVDHLPTPAASTHLVFFDRHGWYCEHGRDCPAVAAVRKQDKGRMTREGWTRR